MQSYLKTIKRCIWIICFLRPFFKLQDVSTQNSTNYLNTDEKSLSSLSIRKKEEIEPSANKTRSIKFYCGHFKPFFSFPSHSLFAFLVSFHSVSFSQADSLLTYCYVSWSFEGRFNGQFHCVPWGSRNDGKGLSENTKRKLTMCCNKFHIP